MDEKRFFNILLAIGTTLCLVATFLFIHQQLGGPQQTPPIALVAQYTYQGPNQAVPGNPQLVRVEVLVRDSPKVGGVQIQSAQFNGQGIPLKPRDIYGNRGTSSFQVPPGKYKLRWVVQRDKLEWPRQVTHEEEVTIDPRDLWLQISIEGEDASIR